jgi:hypothetical protein
MRGLTPPFYQAAKEGEGDWRGEEWPGMAQHVVAQPDWEVWVPRQPVVYGRLREV